MAGAAAVGAQGGGAVARVLSRPSLLLVTLGLLALIFVGYPLAIGLGVLDQRSLTRLLLPHHVEAFRNSLLLAFLTVVPSVMIGVPLAWLVARTDLPGKGLLSLLVTISFVIPILLTSIAYVFLFGRNGGLVNRYFIEATGAPLYNIFSFSGVVIVSVLHSFPLVFFTTLSGLSRMNPELEEAGRICGLSPIGVFFRITLGAVLPSIMAGVAFVIAEALTMLAAPLVIGLPVQIRFMTTELYGTIVMNPDLPGAVALGLPLVVATVVLIWAQARFTGSAVAQRFAVVAGKGSRSETVRLGRWRWPCVVLAWLPVFFAFVLPVITLLAAALMERWFRGLDPGNLSLVNFRFVLNDASTQLAIRNSLVLAFGIGVLMALVGGLMAIALAGEDSWPKKALRALSDIPLGLPHVVAGVLIILAWYGKPFQLGGTLWILAFGYILVMIPFAVRTCVAARGQIDSSLAEAAESVGCTPLQAWRHVLLPLMRNGLTTTFVIVFLFAIKEFSLTAMVYSSGTQTLAVRIFAYLEGGSYEKTAAAAIVLLVLTMLALVAAAKIFRVKTSDLKV